MKVRRSRLAAGSSPLKVLMVGPDSVRSANGAAAKMAAGNGSPALRNASTSATASPPPADRSEEHTSELQSRLHLVCRLLLEKKNKKRRGERKKKQKKRKRNRQK